MMVLSVGEDAKSIQDAQPPSFGDTARSEYCESGWEALELMRFYDYDLIVSDLDLIDMHAGRMVHLARSNGLSVPMIVLAPSSTPQTRISILNSGADDFVMLPCDPHELHARMRAVVRRGNRKEDTCFRVGPLEMNMARRTLMMNGRQFYVSRLEFGVLELMFSKKGTPISKEALIRKLYSGSQEPERKSIDVVMCRLRKRLAQAGAPHLIQTTRGVGYVLRDSGWAAPEDADEIRVDERVA